MTNNPQDALRMAREALSEMIAVATTEDDDVFSEWTADNRAQIDKWQCALSDALSAAANPQQATINVRGFAYTVPQPVKHEYEKVRDRMEALELAACAAIPAAKAYQEDHIVEANKMVKAEQPYDEEQKLSDDEIWRKAVEHAGAIRSYCGEDADEYIEVRRGDMVAMVREFLGNAAGKTDGGEG